MKYLFTIFFGLLFVSACKKPYLSSMAGNYYNNCLDKKPLTGRKLSLNFRNPGKTAGQITSVFTDSNGHFFFKYQENDDHVFLSIEDVTGGSLGVNLFNSIDNNLEDQNSLDLYEQFHAAHLILQFKSDKQFTEKDTLFYYSSLFVDDTARYRFVTSPNNNMVVDSSYFGYIYNEINYVWGIGKADYEKSLATLNTWKKEKYYQCDRIKLNDICSEKEYIIFEK